MYCRKCGNILDDGAVFCSVCGTPVKKRGDSEPGRHSADQMEDADQSTYWADGRKGNGVGEKFVYARAKFTVRDEHEAQDLMQEVYLAAYRNIGSLKNTDSIYSWLGGITLRQGMKLVNRKKRNILLSEDQESVFEDLPDESRGTEERIARAEEVQIMKDCICELSEEQRAVVLAYYYDEMKVEEDAWNVRRQYFRTARNTGWDMRQKEEKNLKKSPEPRKRITGKWIENIS